MEIILEFEDREILSAGSVIGISNKPIIFKIEDLIFEFNFKENKSFSEHKISTEIPKDGKKMKILFENFNNNLGIGNIDPVEIGFIGEKKLFLIYRVYSLTDNAGKLLHYTWLLEKQKGVENVK